MLLFLMNMGMAAGEGIAPPQPVSRGKRGASSGSNAAAPAIYEEELKLKELIETENEEIAIIIAQLFFKK